MNWRFWRIWSRSQRLEAGELARRVHEEWLNRAFDSGREYPSIPKRPVILGGFARLVSKPGGQQLADQWWEAALNRVDRLDGGLNASKLEDGPNGSDNFHRPHRGDDPLDRLPFDDSWEVD